MSAVFKKYFLPSLAFGLVDNTLLIAFGSHFDQWFKKRGDKISPMLPCALGQICSDTISVAASACVECRHLKTAAARVAGMAFGCTMGLLNLLFLPKNN